MAPATVVQGRPPTTLEAALQFNRAPLVALLLVALPLASWSLMVVMARDMYGSMNGASAWVLTASGGWHLVILWAMWVVMMTGMMLPSVSPTLLLYGALVRGSTIRAPMPTIQVYALAGGYLAAWALFSLVATAFQRALASLLVISSMMVVTDPKVGAILLLIAGLYQLSPIKSACLRSCRSPLASLMKRWRSGPIGAFRIGLEQGASCVGCCWALMLLLFVGGVMNLALIASLTAFIAFEKLSPFSAVGRVSGVLLIAAGVWMLVR